MNLMHKHKGFSLVELALVLAIVGLLLSSIVVGFTRYVSQARVKQARADLIRVKEALIGYAMINRRFPCPDINGYPGGLAAPADGVEDVPGACVNAIVGGDVRGNVPYATLGVPSVDPWGRQYYYSVTADYADNNPAAPAASFALGTPLGNMKIRTAAGGALVADEIVALVWSTGAVVNAGSADETENVPAIADDETFVSKDHVPLGAAAPHYDDIVVWISMPELAVKMVNAGVLP